MSNNVMYHSVGDTSANDTRFSSVVNNSIRKSKFMRSQNIKTTFNAARLIPIYIDEVLPGDVHTIDIAHLTRLSTPLFPTMDNIDLDFYFFFVPNRLTFDGWQKLNGENTSSAFVPSAAPSLVPTFGPLPSVAAPFVPKGSLGDYYGLPLSGAFSTTAIPYDYKVSALPFRGYGLIWNRWFRDQNFQAPVVVDISSLDTGNAAAIYPNQSPFFVCKKHDYFTSCLAFSRKPVTTGTPRSISWLSATPAFTDLAIDIQKGTSPVGASVVPLTVIDAIRSAFQLQKLLERDNRGGTRYIEMLKAHFGVQAEDYRLQYPEFLGHCSSKVGMQQVAQTSSTDATSPQGNLAAYSLTIGKNHVFSKSFVEHGYIHGFVVARTRKTYQNGVERFWFRRDRFDFYYPELAQISEQPVLTREIFADKTVLTPNTDKCFGFQEAWADYRYKPNRVCGQFRSDASASLDAWHYAEDFTTSPVMSNSFLSDDSDLLIDRTLAVDSSVNDQFISDIMITNITQRPIPVYSIPGLSDHF